MEVSREKVALMGVLKALENWRKGFCRGENGESRSEGGEDPSWQGRLAGLGLRGRERGQRGSRRAAGLDPDHGLPRRQRPVPCVVGSPAWAGWVLAKLRALGDVLPSS